MMSDLAKSEEFVAFFGDFPQTERQVIMDFIGLRDDRYGARSAAARKESARRQSAGDVTEPTEA